SRSLAHRARHARAVGPGRPAASGTGAAGTPARESAGAGAHRRALLLAAAGALVGALPDATVLVPRPIRRPRTPRRPRRQLPPARRAYGGLLERGLARTHRAARPGDRLPQRAPLGTGDRLRLVGLGPGGVL